MKKVLYNNISATAAQPFKSGTWQHLQEAYTELIVATVQALVGEDYDYSTPYALTNLNNTQTPPDYTIISGFVLFEGVIYETSGTAFTTAGPQVAVGSIATTYLTSAAADPVTFTDGNAHNVHEIKKINFAAGTSGSGAFDYDDIVFVQHPNDWQDLTVNANWATVQTLQYRKNRDGLVTIRGIVQGGASAAYGDTIATLPAGYRPASQPVYSVIEQYNIGTSANGTAFIGINHTTGAIVVFSGAAGAPTATYGHAFAISFYNS